VRKERTRDRLIFGQSREQEDLQGQTFIEFVTFGRTKNKDNILKELLDYHHLPPKNKQSNLDGGMKKRTWH